MAKDKKIPDEIMELARKRQQEYYDKYGEYYFRDTKSERIENMFNWTESPEGHYFWSAVNSGVYKKFYEKYPDKKVKPTYEIY